MIKKTNQHFDMSSDYECHSSSQKTIGQTVKELLLDSISTRFCESQELNVLDLACGPGNLTIEFKKGIESFCPDSQIKITGFDYTFENIARLKKNSRGSIQGVVGSFYETPFKERCEDIIVSNEGLHWQPPYGMSEIIYSHLSEKEKKFYELWALDNFKKNIKNIYNSLKKGGVAILQFGHEGQLGNMWDLVRDILNKEKFLHYKSRVNFPLFYPSKGDIEESFLEANFSRNNFEIDSYYQNLTEETPLSITEFLKAFSEPGFRAFFDSSDLDDFYLEVEKRLSDTNLKDFRHNQWCRTLIRAVK